MEKQLWGKRVADKIHVGERQIDATIRALSEVVIEIQDAQADMSLSPIATDPSLAKIMEAMLLLQQARTSVTAGHRRLDVLAGKIGIRTTGMGFTKPPTGALEEDADVGVRQVNG